MVSELFTRRKVVSVFTRKELATYDSRDMEPFRIA